MSSYRVEVSPNNRAGCQDALCKKNSVKLKKGEIRFGVWVEGTSAGGHEFQSWRWRHWGCVSGKTLQNIRDNLNGLLADEDEYKWDNLDGLEEMPPDYQEKIKLAITEGKIADEDWNGDPAYNVLGKTGIRGRVTNKKRVSEEDEGDADKDATAETPVKPAARKRGRVNDEDEDEEFKSTKRRVTKAKKENENSEEIKLARNTRAKKAGKNEEDEEKDEPKPLKKPRARKFAKKKEEINDEGALKKEPDGEMDIVARPAKKTRAKKVVDKEADNEMVGVKTEETDEAVMDVKSARKARSKKATKGEFTGENQVKKESNQDNKSDAENAYIAQKPEDPLEQIASAFCDRDGPLVSEFNKMVAANEVDGKDWDGFLQKKFRNMIDAGEIADDNFKGFLRKMYEVEVAFTEPEPVAPKRERKGKNKPKTAAKPRPGRSQAF